MSLNSPALAVALLASFSALPQASTPSTTTPAHAALPREKGVLYGVVGRNESIPNGSLLRVDLAKLAIEDLGPVAAHDGLHFPTDAALDPDGKHLWIGYFDGQGRLARARLRGGPPTRTALPELKNDAVAYIAQNPAKRDEYALATFERSVFLTRDGGRTWAPIAERGRGK